jgi:hypothetical protein
MLTNDERLDYLEGLARELGARGLIARVVRSRSGPAYCRVVNPDAASMTENVMCDPAAGVPSGQAWYFWWSWGERMHRVNDPGGAALKVAHVLETFGV